MSVLTAEEGSELLRVAWEALSRRILLNQSYSSVPVHPKLHKAGAAFVTLKAGGALRGCIGRLIPAEPLYLTVAECAVAAATRDPRFEAVTPEELSDISLEVSVLTPLQVVEKMTDIEIGRHGLYVEKSGYQGVLLPQVAVELKLDREQFLSLTCRKAGLSPDAWKSGAVVKMFSAQILHSEAP